MAIGDCMKVLVTGAKGLLAHDVMAELEKRNHSIIKADIEEMDITNQDAVYDFITKNQPDAVIHCAAYTAIDLAENEKEIVMKINTEGSRNVARASNKIGAKMAILSSDYVFDGSGDSPWQTEDEPKPLNAYGVSKFEAEKAVRQELKEHFIVRTSWVFGLNGKNFVKTMINLSKTHDKLTVVADQVGSPTYTKDLARILVDFIETDKYGTYHATNEGYLSWCDFAKMIFKTAGITTEVIPVTTEEYGAPALRPKNSRLSKDKLDKNGFTRLPSVSDALKRYIKELRDNGQI